MAKVAVNAEVLSWAIQRANTTVEMLRDRFPKLPQWLDGTTQPSLSQLEGFSTATLTPLGWLFLDTPPLEEMPIPFYRTTTDAHVRRASAELFDTIYAIQRRQEWMREHLIDAEGESPLPFVGSANLDTPPAEIASRMRRVLGLSEDWAAAIANVEKAIATLRQAMDNVGIFVVANGVVGNNTSRTLNAEEFRGFVLVDDYAPFVFVNSADAKVAQMFTLAHELAHVFLGASAAFDLHEFMPSSDRTERVCNQAAAEFLVPDSRLRKLWQTNQGPQRYRQLADIFKVSRIVIARRAKSIGLISSAEFSEFYKMCVKDTKAKKAKGGNFYNSQPGKIGERFGRAVVGAVRAGLLPFTEAYSLTGLSGKSFDRYAESVG